MTADQMRAEIRAQCLARKITVNGLDSTSGRDLELLHKAFCGGSIVSNAGQRTFVVNGGLNAETLRLACEFKLLVNSSISIEELSNMGAPRLNELLGNAKTLAAANADPYASYNPNDPTDEAGKTLRAVTALKNAMTAADPGAIATLGLATVQDWHRQIDKAVASMSATSNGWPNPPTGNSLAADYSNYSINAVARASTSGSPAGAAFRAYNPNEHFDRDEWAGYSLNDPMNR